MNVRERLREGEREREGGGRRDECRDTLPLPFIHESKITTITQTGLETGPTQTIRVRYTSRQNVGKYREKVKGERH